MPINTPNGLVARPALIQALSQALKIPAQAIAFSDTVKSLDGIQAIHHVPTAMTWFIPVITGETVASFNPPVLITNKQNIDLTQFNVDRGNFQQRPQYSFIVGFTLRNGLETVVYEGVEYRWTGAFPKTVVAGSAPIDSGWVGVISEGLSGFIIRTLNHYRPDSDGFYDAAIIDLQMYYIRNSRYTVELGSGTFPLRNTLTLMDGVQLHGDGKKTLLNFTSCTAERLIILNGFTSRVDNFKIRGNLDVLTQVGISANYVTENGGGSRMIIENCHNGLDVDKIWYSSFSDFRFRTTTSSVELKGSHIRIGYNDRVSEVNGVLFANMYMSEKQQHCVSFYCPTQATSFLTPTFENTGGARINFVSGRHLALRIDTSYIEGVKSTGDTFFAVNNTGAEVGLTLAGGIIRLTGSGKFVDGVNVHFDRCWSNSPDVTLFTSGNHSTSTTFPYFKDSVGASSFTQAVAMRGNRKDIMATTTPVINSKAISAGATTDVYKIYIASDGNVKIYNLDLSVGVKSTTENYIEGFEDWKILITTPTASGDVPSGSFVSRKSSGVKPTGSTLLADSSVTLSYVGVTNSYHVFTLRHTSGSATRSTFNLYSISGAKYSSDIQNNSSSMYLEAV